MTTEEKREHLVELERVHRKKLWEMAMTPIGFDQMPDADIEERWNEMYNWKENNE